MRRFLYRLSTHKALEEPLRGSIDDIEKKMRVLAKPMRTRACAQRDDDGAAANDGDGDGGATKSQRKSSKYVDLYGKIV